VKGRKVFSLLFAFMGKPRKKLGYKKQKHCDRILKAKILQKSGEESVENTKKEREKQDAGIEKCVF